MDNKKVLSDLQKIGANLMSPDLPFNVVSHCCLLCYRGSIAHNLYIEPEEKMGTDDIDIIGVAIPPLKYFLSNYHFEQIEILPTEKNPYDIVIYDIRKFFRLLYKANPNVIGALWNRLEMYLVLADEGRKIIANRTIFNSKWLYNTFVGYAVSQLKKMESCAYKGYMGEKRKVLVEEFGYDTKNASHLIRLLTMGKEFLSTGEIKVYRETDRDFLIDIKQGKFKLDQIKKWTDMLFDQIREALDKSGLPDKPNPVAINSLLYSINRNFFLGKLRFYGE